MSNREGGAVSRRREAEAEACSRVWEVAGKQHTARSGKKWQTTHMLHVTLPVKKKLKEKDIAGSYQRAREIIRTKAAGKLDGQK